MVTYNITEDKLFKCMIIITIFFHYPCPVQTVCNFLFIPFLWQPLRVFSFYNCPCYNHHNRLYLFLCLGGWLYYVPSCHICYKLNFLLIVIVAIAVGLFCDSLRKNIFCPLLELLTLSSSAYIFKQLVLFGHIFRLVYVTLVVIIL